MRGEESSPDPVAVVGEPLPARRRSTLEDLFRAPTDDDSSREEGLLDEGLHLDADGNPLETRALGRGISRTRLETRASPRVPAVVVSYEPDPRDGNRRHATTRVLEEDRENDCDFSRDASSRERLGSRWNDRGNFYFEKQRRKCLVPHLVATGTDAGRSMVRVRGRGWLKLLNYDAFTSLVEAHCVMKREYALAGADSRIAKSRNAFFWQKFSFLVLPKHLTRTDHGTAVGVRGRRDGFVRSQRGAREAHARGGAPPRAGARWPAEDAATRIAAPGGAMKAGATGRHLLLNPGWPARGATSHAIGTPPSAP